MTLGPGSLVNGKYRLVRLLGEGGMGAIWEAKHEFLGTDVALKFLHPALSSRPNVVARFVQEARVSANIKSPHVVGVIDVDQSPEGLAYLVMELLRGEVLSARLAREPMLPIPLALITTAQVLLALEVAHTLGVVHRDMKPENVFLTHAPGAHGATKDGLVVKVLDFGIAKLRTLGEVKKQLTRPGIVMGTPEYMSPEQVFAADAVDARADIYAVGAMLFEMLAGRRPIQGDDPRAIAGAVIAGQIPRLDAICPRVPTPIADAVAIALSAQPNDRFSSASAMRRALSNAVRESGLDIELPLPAQPSRPNLPSVRMSRDASNSRSERVNSEAGNLGEVGLGVAPRAMLGPGDHASILKYDAQVEATRGGNKPPARSVAIDPDGPNPTSPEAVVPYVAGSAELAAARAALPPRNQVGTGTEAVSAQAVAQAMAADVAPPRDVGMRTESANQPPRDDSGRTMAAEPTPFTPGYGATNIPSPGTGTDAGAPSPYGAMQMAGGGPTYSGDYDSYEDVPSRRSSRWLPIVVGIALVIGLALVVFAVLRPTGTPTGTQSSEDDEPSKKKKKSPDTVGKVVDPPTKPTLDPDPPTKPTASASTKPTVFVPGTGKLPPRPTGTGTSTTAPSTTTPPFPFPSTTGTDILPIPLPWPPPIPT